MSESKKHLSQEITAPSSPDAQKWDGWGTGLKPTVEPIVMARKPVEGTVANNVLTYGTGGLNIDASRIGTETITTTKGKGFAGSFEGGINNNGGNTHEGRWPANLILDEQAAELVDEQSGTSKSPKTYVRGVGTLEGERVAYANIGEVAGTESKNYGDSGGASRFFYVAKASKRDRNEGLEDLEESVVGSYAGNVANKGNKIGANPDKPNQPAKNFHPTVKPTQLMRYLVKLITPPGGTVLDPFTGSGSTGKAAILEGFDFIGIELTEDYWPIIEGRLKHAEAKVAERIKETSDQEQEKLF
jgi:site-specific DNA-methyltransferase (adenine-specific)